MGGGGGGGLNKKSSAGTQTGIDWIFGPKMGICLLILVKKWVFSPKRGVLADPNFEWDTKLLLLSTF